MMHYRILSSTVFLALISISDVSLANSLIWFNDQGNLTAPAGNPAAKFSVTGTSSVVSQSTIINYFNDGSCAIAQSTVPTNGSFTFSNGQNNLQASGNAVWNINPTTNTLSVQVIPMTGPNGSGTPVFTITPCFAVTCSALSSNCSYAGSAISVTLS
jgi:sugar lactone lactonase YvrE